MEKDIQEALADLETQDEPNYSAAARQYKVGRTTLMRRHKHKTRSRQDFLSEQIQCLSKDQEETLIYHINRMTDRGQPPTSQIVKNFAEEIIGKTVGKNWTAQFVRRHKDRLKSVYLRCMDNQRIKSEYEPLLQHFFDLVELFCVCFDATVLYLRHRLIALVFYIASVCNRNLPYYS
jgi:hypothetical protein